MTRYSKVVWSEGLFLHPQHFQQQERYLENEFQCRTRHFNPYSHGFVTLQMDTDLIHIGKVGILRAEGYFQDGTYFCFPDKDPTPLSIDFPDDQQEQTVYLTLPKTHWHAVQLARDNTRTSEHPFKPLTVEITNTCEPQSEAEPLEVAVLNTHLQCGNKQTEGMLKLPVCHITRQRKNEIRVDERFIVPTLCAIQNPAIDKKMWLVKNLLENRIAQLQQRKIRKGSSSTSEIGDFLLLQTCSKYLYTFQHFSGLRSIHPEPVYLELLKLLGDLTPFAQVPDNHSVPAYNHDALQMPFEWVLNAIQGILSGVHEQHAIQIALQEKQFGIHVGTIADLNLLQNAQFILTVHANLPDEQVQRHFPSTVKIAPVERLRDLVNLNLPGIKIKPLNQGPRALPYFADHLYFQLETKAEPLWKQLEHSGNLAIHFAGDMPGLRMQLWAIRKESEVLA